MSRLPLPQPYNFGASTARYRIFGRDPANLWHENGLHRVVEGREVRITEAPGGVDVEPFDERTQPVVRTLLGADFALDAFYEFAATEPALAPLIERLRGLRPPIAVDPYEALVTSITAQQVSLFAALAIRRRLIERFGIRARHAYAFPSREQMAAVDPGELTALGFSRRKAESVIGLARADVDFAGLHELPDDEVKETLIRLPGIGEWTADWFLARHLARPRAWPAGDLALRYAVSALYGDGRMLSIRETRELAVRFDPFQNLSAHYLLVAHRNPG